MQHELMAAAKQLGVNLGASEARLLEQYAALIRKWNKVRNLVADADPATLLHQHLIDCIAVLPYINGERIADVGSGAGLPGIVIAVLKPDAKVWLIETKGGKTRFLEQVRIELGLPNLTVINTRIQDWGNPTDVDALVCRGYASLQRFCEDTQHLHRASTRLIAMKGEMRDTEIAACRDTVSDLEIHPLDVPTFQHRHVVLITP